MATAVLWTGSAVFFETAGRRIGSLNVNLLRLLLASGFLAVQEEFGSFDAYLWAWGDGMPVVTRREPADGLPAAIQWHPALVIMIVPIQHHANPIRCQQRPNARHASIGSFRPDVEKWFMIIGDRAGIGIGRQVLLQPLGDIQSGWLIR